MARAQNRAGSIVETPRPIDSHPLLKQTYNRHDRLIAAHLPEDADHVLEIAMGQYLHPDATLGLDALDSNVRDGDGDLVGDARRLPLADDSLDAAIGRRFLHHAPDKDRPKMVQELSRVVRPGGTVVVLEGTPGVYRSLTKGLAFRLGLLGDDTDEYGHLSQRELVDLVDGVIDIETVESLGSPLMPLARFSAKSTVRIGPMLDRTQWVQWWSLIIGNAD